MPDTLASMRAEVQDWLGGETVPTSRIDNAINDGIESLWESLILAALQVYMNGPVNVSISEGSEGVVLATLLDPTTGPALGPFVSGTLPAHDVYAAYTLVTDSGSETLASPTAHSLIPVNNLASIGGVFFVSGALGWNLYAGNVADRLAKQNDEPIPFGASFDEPPEGLAILPNAPPVPVENTTGDNIFYIRHLEFQTTQGWLKSYSAGDLDSEFMRRMAGSIATSSEYQNYAWDLLNQRQLEIRPKTGRAFTPRYFYIVKPRRLRFANAPLPFPNTPQIQYLRASALSAVFLTLHEYDASAAWDAKAARALAQAVRALTAMNANHNERVTPFLY